MGDDKSESTARPDAAISIFDGTSFNRTVGYGEIKPERQALKHRLVSMDLVRIGQFAKDVTDTNGTAIAFAFQVIGKDSR